MEFNRARLEQDLLHTASVIYTTYNKDFIEKNLLSYNTLNQALLDNCSRMIIADEELFNESKVDEVLNKREDRELFRFIRFLNENEETLTGISKSYLDLHKKLGIYDVPFYDKIRHYSEKDFKDLILSYFATFGNVPYEVAKTYFDEQRLHINEEGVDFDCGGYCSWLEWLQSGYIFSAYSDLDSMNAGVIAHELGHIIDANTVFFSQHKDIPWFSDAFLELSSTSFELGFYDYLKKNHIDITGSEILLNGRLSYLNRIYTDLHEVLTTEKDIIIEPDGDAYVDEEMVALEELQREAIVTGKEEDLDGLFIDTHPIRKDVLYGLGYWMALHLNLIREQNPKEFYKTLSNITMQRKELSLEDSIALAGFSLDDFKSGKLIIPKITEEHMSLKRRYKL